jgi:hypothetical protein
MPMAWTHLVRVRPNVLASTVQALAALGLTSFATAPWLTLAEAYLPNDPDYECGEAADDQAAVEAARAVAASACAAGAAVALVADITLAEGTQTRRPPASSRPQHLAVDQLHREWAATRVAAVTVASIACIAVHSTAMTSRREWGLRNSFRLLRLSCSASLALPSTLPGTSGADRACGMEGIQERRAIEIGHVRAAASMALQTAAHGSTPLLRLDALQALQVIP